MHLKLTTYFSILFLFFFNFHVSSQNKINLTIKNIKKDSVMIAYYYGDKQFILGDDNGKNHYIKFDENGKGEFISNELKKGLYLLVFPPNNEYVQFLFDENDLDISLDRNSLQEGLRFKNSLTNTLFYQHITFIKVLTEEREEILKNHSKGVNDKEIEEKASLLDTKYQNYSKDFISKYSHNLAAQLLKSNSNVEIPSEYTTNEERFNYYKKNYFNNIDFNNPWLIRTPFFHNKVEYYIENLTSKAPYEIIKSVDYILDSMKNTPDLFKYFVVNFLNKYAKSKLMTSENIYAHIVKNYYLTGKANWVDKDQLDKIIDNYNRIKNSLIGSIVNDFELISSTHKTSKLYDDNSEFKILYFWKSTCKECNLDEYVNKIPKNTKLYSIPTDFDKKQLNTYTKSNKPYFLPSIISDKDKTLVLNQLNINSYLHIFLLDKNNEIIGKRISFEQVLEIINNN
tara:strand:+ start:494 stop:1858 length:1365 start_codon:yes stop_codon:yes gene_type:complete